jgi:hypothetical protein
MAGDHVVYLNYFSVSLEADVFASRSTRQRSRLQSLLAAGNAPNMFRISDNYVFRLEAVVVVGGATACFS